MIPLYQGEVNQKYKFVGFSAVAEAERHLSDLGLVKGAELEIVARNGRDSFILLVQQTRLAITKELSEQMMIQEISADFMPSYRSLDRLLIGEFSVVAGILGRGAIKRRLMDMGITKGVEVAVENVAPLGDPMEVMIRGYKLTLRKAEAKHILVLEAKENKQ